MLALGVICTCASDAAHCVCDCLLLCSQVVPGSLQGAASGVLYPLQPDKFWGKLLMELDRNCDQDTKEIQRALCLCLAQFLMVASICLQVTNCWNLQPQKILGEHSKRCWLSFYFLLLHDKARCGPGLIEGARNLLTRVANRLSCSVPGVPAAGCF